MAACIKPVMNVGKLNHAKAVKGLRQAIQMDSFMLDGQNVRLGECGRSDMRQAKCEGTQRRVWLFGAAVWRDTSTLVPSNGSRHILGFRLRQPAGETPRRWGAL